MVVDSQVFGFTFLMFGQQMFAHMFDNKENAEWERIRPALKQLHEAMSEDNMRKGYARAVNYNGIDPVVYNGLDDLWYILYSMSNYRVPRVDRGPKVKEDFDVYMHMVLNNVCKKSHKHYNRWISRFI